MTYKAFVSGQPNGSYSSEQDCMQFYAGVGHGIIDETCNHYLHGYIYTDTSNTKAFYAYMDTHETNPGRHQTLFFDVVKTNLRSAYNKHSGLFTSPDIGIYVFAWTLISDLNGYIYSEIMINSAPFGSIQTNITYGFENEDRRIPSISNGQLKGIIEYQAKHENRIRKLEQKFRIRELKQDTRIRELEQKFRIRELEQDTRIRELKQDIRNHKLNQADRIRKLEHTIRIQSKQIEDLIEDFTNLKVNDAFGLSHMNGTVSKTSDIIAKQADSNELKRKHTRSYGKNENMERMSDRKRLFLNTNPSSMVAFYAYMNTHETNPGRHQTLIFDEVKINLGSAYSKNSGLFTSPDHGIYVFTWTVVADEYGFVYSEIVINSTPFGSILTNSQDVRDFHTVTGIVVAEVNKGDEIYIRTNPNYPIKGRIVSDSSLRTSFSGWKIDDIQKHNT
ncbi:C1QL [Mytilus coruscus]|uniref:C1QL n=1 Tax=Mytilus coruscus TaxID=42192 RepID=A0A6J8BHK2_MYTCO|nr:C1QL [Mytilus coruscus]